jgi:PPK2 family polyphosphate:nucleotide phosphotransferase
VRKGSPAGENGTDPAPSLTLLPVAAVMKIDPHDFRVAPARPVKLSHWPTQVRPCYDSKHDYKRQLADHTGQLRRLQNLLYAHNRHALLLIFQAMDAAGKDSAIKHVMSGVNPQGCQVFSFKHPSAQELDHDFLWRTTRCLPERGRIGIFNRSYYEEVLVARVHPEIIQRQSLPGESVRAPHFWRKRYHSINDLEKHLHRNGTHIVKFFLHLSPEEQRRRFLARLDDPEKNWKFSPADVEERKFWPHYMSAYERCLSATSTKHAPWYVVPADDKPNARLIISQVILGTLHALPMHYPEPDDARLLELQAIREKLGEK